jgi:hypothetical protein
MKLTTTQHLQLIWAAIRLKPIKFINPYEYYSDLRKDIKMECDNIHRSSGCTNIATVALSNQSIELVFTEAENYYHVCDKCGNKYIGTMYGEDGEE